VQLSRGLLVVSPFAEDHAILKTICGHSDWEVHSASTCQEALAFVGKTPVPVVFCERDLPDSDWKDLFDKVSRLAAAALLIVASRFADGRLWSEVLNLGGHDVLLKPFDGKEVTWSLGLAWKQEREPARGVAGTSSPMLASARAGRLLPDRV
jgi:DNA-binding NtrC family response regulator